MDLDTRLGHYRIIGRLGAGGMGEVYRAEDTRLRRDVAVKVLPRELADDPDRLARLEREAQLLAALDHPNIAAVYGLEESAPAPGDGNPVRYLVMQLAEGETLADRLAAGPLDPGETRAVTEQLIAGLEAAHERGVIHRDLKPANVMVAPDGAVKILDFGLAKAAVTEDGAPRATDLTASPTILGATVAGMIMGTASYMAPEQARGRPVDKRADIWALGCVVYEMLAGATVFDGDTATDIIAALVKDEPDWSRLPPGTPAELRRLVRRCLVKDPRRRLRDLGDARIELEQGVEASEIPAGAAPRPSPAMMLAVGAIGLIAGLLAARWLGSPEDDSAAVRRASLRFPTPITVTVASLDISPDGQRVVYLASDSPGGVERLWVRDLADGTTVALPNTDEAFAPFFSYDGAQVGFWADGELRKVRVDGVSSPVAITDVPSGLFGVWSSAGDIYAATGRGGLLRVPDGGGETEVILEGDGSLFYGWPTLLPGERAVIATTFPNAAQTDLRNAKLVRIDLADGRQTVLADELARPFVLPGGDLVAFGEGGVAAILPYDGAAERLAGPALPLRDRVEMVFGAWPMVALSRAGTLVYLANSTAAVDIGLYWLDENLDVDLAFTPPVGRFDIDSQLSPDGTLVALEYSGDTAGVSIWLLDLERGTFAPLADHDPSTFATWSPDGRWVAYLAAPDGESAGVFRVPVDRSAPAERLSTGVDGAAPRPTSWHPDGSVILFHQDNDLWLLPTTGDRAPRPFLTSDANESRGRFSPDGSWVAYRSDRSGRTEIWASPYPGPGGAVQISNAGGISPDWSRDGRRILYRDTAHGLWQVQVRIEDGRLIGQRPERFAAGDGIPGLGGVFVPIGTDRDGRRLGFVQPIPQPPTQLEIVFDWFHEVERLMAPER